MMTVNNHIELLEIKVQAVDELLRRYHFNNITLNHDEKKPEAKSVPYKKSICFASSMTIFLGAMYWGVTDILVCVGLITATSLLVSPIGLAIAGGVALLFSAGLAIYHYQGLQKK